MYSTTWLKKRSKNKYKNTNWGESLVVWAIHEGRQVAKQVDYELMGYSALAGPGGVLVTQLKNDCLENHEHEGILATKPI
jgi:hypothetical protein